MAELDDVISESLEMLLAGHHCSEVILTTIGRRRVKGFDPALMRIATGFGGGIAEAADVCGALVGAIMVIGLLHGRTSLDEDQTRCWELSRRYRERFKQELILAHCDQIGLMLDGDDAGTKCLREFYGRLRQRLYLREIHLEPGEQPDSLSDDRIRGLLT